MTPAAPGRTSASDGTPVLQCADRNRLIAGQREELLLDVIHRPECGALVRNGDFTFQKFEADRGLEMIAVRKW